MRNLNKTNTSRHPAIKSSNSGQHEGSAIMIVQHETGTRGIASLPTLPSPCQPELPNGPACTAPQTATYQRTPAQRKLTACSSRKTHKTKPPRHGKQSHPHTQRAHNTHTSPRQYLVQERENIPTMRRTIETHSRVARDCAGCDCCGT